MLDSDGVSRTLLSFSYSNDPTFGWYAFACSLCGWNIPIFSLLGVLGVLLDTVWPTPTCGFSTVVLRVSPPISTLLLFVPVS